ncbi:MAG: DUF1559 domain-containing protein [Planctomycetaceae bacterium]|jgi:prepilin-type processing-associated H-X9-DG protein|nr:DUF1559 domain-containing protein [Planctomycetaceae bacterium]
MGHEFPLKVNWDSTLLEVVVAHAFSLSFVFAAIGCLILSKRWSPEQSHVWTWAMAMLATPIANFLIASNLDPQSRQAADPLLNGYQTAFWLIASSGMWMTHRRLKAAGQTSSFAFIMISLFLTVFGYLILIPTCIYPNEAARRTQCKSNLTLIGIALFNHHDIHGSFPKSAAGAPPVSWRLHVLPHLDNVGLFESYDQTATWDSKRNTPHAKQHVQSLSCPTTETTTDIHDRWLTHYAMVTGERTVGDGTKLISFKDVTDGTSNTMMVVEAAGLNIVWTEPRDSEVSENNLGVNLTGPTPTESRALISAWHRNGGHVLFADGSVRFINRDIDPQVLKALTTANGRESLPDSH